MKNKGAKQKLKRKGAASAFGCDLTEYLESSGQDVPYVLKSCAEFIETHGIVDGIYRLSGVTSNIQRLRQEFGSDQCPNLTREVYLQDIHCVGSLCKLYFRELPNPLLTYELYEKFTEAVSHCPEEGQLARIQNVIQELPPSHYRTLEYLIRHLAHIASFSSKTNMHARNLALVWAPNLLRSKEIEATGCNGDAAFLAVRVQQVVIEFILNHVDQIFNNGSPGSLDNDENRPIMKSLTLPALSLPMKLVSLEEAQARSLATNHPARKERRENSLPEIVPPMGTLFHTVLELPDNKRKLSSKSKKWKSIFNLGRSGSDSKSKLSRNGSVFVRGQRLSVEKATIRPAKSMDSLCSVPVEGKETKGNFNRTVTTGGFFIPAVKMHSTSTGSSCDLGSWRRSSTGRRLGELQRRRWSRRRPRQQERALGLSLTMPTVEELYRNYGILADATEQVGQHKDAYQVILDGVKGGTKEKRLAAQFIPKFFKHFPELADSAINAQLDLCEDEDVSIRRQAIKELPQFATGENLPRVADILTQLLQTDDSAEFNLVNNALLSIFKMDAKGTLGGLFSQILQGEDIVRERAIKFLSTKLKTLPDEVLTKEVEELILTESKKVLEDVTGEEFVLFMKILSGLKSLQTVSGRQQLVELVAEQADLEQTFNPSDPDCVDRLLQCTRQAVPLFSKNVHSTRFVTYFCEQVLPNLSSLTTPVEGLDIQLEVLKLLAEMSSFCGDMEKLETNLRKLFDKLLEYMPLPPEEAENGENAGNEEPKLQFSYVECLLYSFHQLGRKLPDFLTAKLNAEKLKDFKIRLQYFARGLQVYIRQLRLALQGKTGEALKTEENKIKVVALKITNNINVLIKDLFHIPPSYKSTVTLSWKPVQKVEIGQKRANEDTTSGSPPKKPPTGPKRDARQIYNPPSGKYSSNLGNFNYERSLQGK